MANSEKTGPGNVDFGVQTKASAELYVIYHYIPSDCLKPGDYTVVETQPTPYIDGQETSGNTSPLPGTKGTDFIKVTLNGSGDSTNNNFGELLPATLGNFVWEDANGNGIQDNGEQGIAGVVLDLFDGNGNFITTATTDASGYYQFSNLTPGTYSVAPDAINPALIGYTGTISNQGTTDTDSNLPTATTTLLSGGSDQSLDFGYYKLASLGDYVWEDANANGVQDSGEQGIAGVKLNLTGTTGAGATVTLSTTTDANGKYSFDNLAPGTYSVTVDASSSALNGYTATATGKGTSATDSNPSPTSTTLASGDNDPTLDFGYYKLASLGDYVWEDANANGVQDSGEQGIAGVKLNLTGTTGAGATVTLSTTTDANGKYSFDNLVPGTYSVTVDASSSALSGYTATVTGKGTSATDSNPSPTSTTLASGDNDPTLDFGFYKLASLGDYVWVDANANGVQDSGEKGIAGVKLNLSGTTGAGATVTLSTTTDSNGKYSFNNLVPGIYTVTVDASSSALNGYTATVTGKGTSATDSNPSPTSTTLVSGGSDLTLDFGYYKLACLGDYVWEDANANGVQDSGEKGIAGVKLNLSGTTGAGATVTLSTTTDSNGKYSFNNLVPGTYTVTVDTSSSALNGYTATVTGKGTSATDSNPSPTSTTLASGGIDQTLDFGYYKLAKLGDYVWVDTNRNGIQDDGSTGVNGLTVTLTGTTGAGQTVTKSTTTINNPSGGAAGYYVFDSLVPGSYTVKFTAPSGYTFTTQNASGSTTSNDSNANTSTGVAAAVILASGEYNQTIDAGLVCSTGSISGTKYNDLTGNGLTADDTPLAGVKVYIDKNNNKQWDSGETFAITDANGNYSFTGLAVGNYTIREVVGSGWIRTGPTLSDNYVVTVTAGNNSGGNDFANADLGCDCQISNIVYIINGCRQVTDLRGNVDPGDTVTAKFTVKNASTTNPAVFSLVSYTAPGATFVAADAYKQEIYDLATASYTTNGTYTLTVDVPNSYYQVDFVCGKAIDRFGPDGSNIFYTPQQRLFSADNGGSTLYKGALKSGDIGSASFWCGTTGQNLIKSLNGSSSATNLGNWLVTNFPNLYGSKLTTKTNTAVAAYFKTLSTSSLEAQVMATALSVYVTNLDLAGAVGNAYGFHSSYLGSGSKVFNVGSYGSSLGLTNNTSYTLFDILDAADSKASNGTILGGSSNATKRSNATTLFTNLNKAGA